MNMTMKMQKDTEKETAVGLDAASLALPSSGSISNAERKAFHDFVADMSAADADFRARLMQDPKATIESSAQQILGRSLELSEQGRVIVLDDSINVLNVVLPYQGTARADVLEMGELTPLLRRAASDPLFRQAVLSAPQATVSSFLEQSGTPIPSFVEVKVTEISDQDAVVFMPPAQTIRGEAATLITAHQYAPEMYHTEGGCYTMWCRTSDDCHQTNTTTLNASCPTFTYQPRC